MSARAFLAANARDAYKAAYSTWMRVGIRWYPAPRVLVNSVPKAGTHLVVEVLSRLPQMGYAGVHVQPETVHCVSGAPVGEAAAAAALQQARAHLQGVRNGQYATAHLPAWPGFEDALGDLGFRTMLVLRDPRDLAVSFAFYVARLHTHHLHRRFCALDSDEARIAASITGLPETAGGPALLSIGDRVGAFLAWADVPDVLVLRFEELVGARGGGEPAEQVRTVSDLAGFVGRPLALGEAERVANEIWTPHSSTFRRGVQGDWRQRFTPELRALFREHGGSLLVEMGYEHGPDW